jgi:acetolactate synthase I/II/III large subunit
MTAVQRLTGGAAIVEALISNGVNTVFGLPGAQMYPFFDALQLNAERIRTIGARHEQACGYMAFGYARSTGRPGVCAVVPGPGVLNTAAALCTAMGCCAPVLCITGQVPSAFLGKERGHLHELKDQLGALSSIVKWTARIERPADAPRVINEAFRQMLSGRPGPVVVEMAWDMMASAEEVALLASAEIPPPPRPSPESVDAAARVLAGSKRPMIFTGSGAQHAAPEVLALAEVLQAPVTALRGGRGVVAEDHPLGISSYAARLLYPDCDAAIGIGTRMELPFMRWTGMMTMIDRPEAPPHVVRIDIDPEEMRRLVPHAGIVADSAEGARALAQRVLELRGAPAAKRGDIADAKAAARQAIQKVQPQLAYLDVIRAALPRDGIVVGELSQVGFTSYFGYPVLEPRTYISEGFQGTLGFGFQTALGVKAAHSGKPVMSITGDGGFMFGVQELATAAQYGIGLITLLFNNSAYGNVMRDQRERFGNRLIGAALQNPDFMDLARAFGVKGYRVNSPEALAALLPLLLATSEPVLVEVDVPEGSEMSPWEFIHAKL